MKNTILLFSTIFLLLSSTVFAQESKQIDYGVSTGLVSVLDDVSGYVFCLLTKNDMLFLDAIIEDDSKKMAYIHNNTNININKRDPFYGTAPIHIAIIEGSLKAVKYLKKIDADFNLKVKSSLRKAPDSKLTGKSPLELAKMFKDKTKENREIYQFLLGEDNKGKKESTMIKTDIFKILENNS